MKNLQELADHLNQNNLFPFFNCQFTANLCDSVIIRASKQKKEDWSNGIMHNSPYLIISVMPKTRDGRETETCEFEVELLSWGFNKKETKFLRKKTGTLDQIASHLQKYFENI